MACNIRCLWALSPPEMCKCSCGGAEHGKGWERALHRREHLERKLFRKLYGICRHYDVEYVQRFCVRCHQGFWICPICAEDTKLAWYCPDCEKAMGFN